MMGIMAYRYIHLVKIFMSSTKEGATNNIKLEETPSNVLTDLFYSKVEGSTTESKLNTINEALDAIYSINGIEENSASNTIETLPGVKIELLKVTDPIVENKPSGETGTDTKADQKGIDLKFTVSDSNVTDATNLIKNGS